ncbi:MAG: hypothetical protein H0U45_14555 [Tatlockia sp.]|jgi:hypothetical protein|nr:hypothetical protein [Tatlockia sp.]
MPNASARLIAHILKDLNFDVPNHIEMENLIQKAAEKVAIEQGLDPQTFDYTMVPIEKEWMRQYLNFASKKG